MPLLLRHLVVISLIVLGALTVAVLPSADVHIGASASVATASIVLLIALDLVAGALLIRRHLRTGAERSLGLGMAYALAGGLAAAQALRHGNPAAWAWVGWHLAFPSCFALSMALSTSPGPRRPARALGYVAGALVAAGAFVALAAAFPDVLRPGTLDLKPMAGAEVLTVNLVAMLVVVLRARRRTPLERWLIVAAAAASTDVVLTLAANGATGALGFWTGRALGVMAAVVALGALVREARRPQPRALFVLELGSAASDVWGAAGERLRAALRGDDTLERRPDGAFALVLTGVDAAEAGPALTRLGSALAGEGHRVPVLGGWTLLAPGEQPGSAALARAAAELRSLPGPPSAAPAEPALGVA